MIIPEYDKHFEYEDYGLDHSYQIEPPSYSEPQILYNFYYSGGTMDVLSLSGTKELIWAVKEPFYIVSGQGTTNITLALSPILTKDREPIITVTGITTIKYTYRQLDHCDLTLTIKRNNVIIWEDVLNLYYKQGSIWKIEGNKNPKINTIETYTISPLYIQSGNPPKNTTHPDSYSFKVKDGKVKKIYGGTAPINGAWINNFLKVDIEWYKSGYTYLSFYSAWTNEKIKFPNTIGITVTL